MIKKAIYFLVVLGLALHASIGLAADATVSWDAVEGADHYEIEMSTNLGDTWEVVGSTTDTKLKLTGLPDEGLLLFRAVTVNSAGDRFPRLEAGAWWNEGWKPLQNPVGTGIE